MTAALFGIARTEGLGALYKGLAPTLVGIAPYAALNFASYDALKQLVYGRMHR
jgi:solute carrier family 25 phosphate transporter 23/24/25/41